MNKEEIASINCDLLILDEFHHIGAPVWGARINELINTHPQILTFGMTAYTVRDRNTPYERDMANPDTNELFSNNIVSRYDLCDAMIDGIIPKPIYKSAYINLISVEQELEDKVNGLDSESETYKTLMSVLESVKKRIHEAPSIFELMKKNIKPNGKYIYFCPPCSEENTNDIETIKKQAMEIFSQFVKKEDIYFYTSTSEMGIEGKNNRDNFYNDYDNLNNDVSGKLRVMFAINQYNEGIHAPNIDGVIMGRGTASDIVYFEQLGRALSVKGDTLDSFNKYEKYELDELRLLCSKRDIIFNDKEEKSDLIEKLIAPIILDLTNNYEFIKELENNLKDRIKEVSCSSNGLNKRNIKILNAIFDIEIENQDLYEMLRYVSNRLTKTWDDMYEYAKKYYEVHHDLEVPTNFKTNNGYDYDKEGTINLGTWIRTQRINCDPLSDRGKKLSEIGMRFGKINNMILWEEMYEYAKKYYEVHHDLEVPDKFKTNNGYDYDKEGTINLGIWIQTQRTKCDPLSDRGKKLSEIGMRFKTRKVEKNENISEVIIVAEGELKRKQ